MVKVRSDQFPNIVRRAYAAFESSKLFGTCTLYTQGKSRNLKQ